MNYTTLPLFSYPIHVSEGRSPTEEVLEFARNLEYKFHERGKFHISTDTYVLNLEELKDTRDLLQLHLNEYVHSVLGVDSRHEIYFTNSWIVKYSKGSYAGTHKHTNSCFSGTYYLNTPEDDDSEFIIYNPNSYNIFPVQFQPVINHYNIFNSTHWSLKPKKGNIFLWPSALDHSVSPITSNEERIMLAFNAYIKGDFSVDPINVDHLIL
jgi:uncharacterized protein (TIGR02466 family)